MFTLFGDNAAGSAGAWDLAMCFAASRLPETL
jgi:hypothetical protein